LTDSGRRTYKVVKRPSISLAQDNENLPAKIDILTTICYITNMRMHILGITWESDR